MKKLLFILTLLIWVACEDNKTEPEPVGTLGITMRQPIFTYFNDWWSYASKYEIFIDDNQEEVGTFSGFNVTNIETSPGAHTVGAVITDSEGIWLYAVQNSATVQKDLVTEVEFSSWYSHNYPTPDYLNSFDSLDDLNISFGEWSIQDSKLYAGNLNNFNIIEWNNSTSIIPEMRVAIEVATDFSDTVLVGIGLGNSISNNYYYYFLGNQGIFLAKWDAVDNQWYTINSNIEIGANGRMLLVYTDSGYIHCYLNDDRKVYGSLIGGTENFDIVAIYHSGITDAYFDNLGIYGNIGGGLSLIPLEPYNKITAFRETHH